MSEKDDVFLEELNKSREKEGLSPVAEDDFETIMDAFEAAIQVKQPYLTTDPLKVSSYEGMEDLLDDTLSPSLKPISKLVYEHWRTLKIAREGKSIVPSLRVRILHKFVAVGSKLTVLSTLLQFEQNNEKDDGDPYVCFRRREVRGVRKTRRTDAQSSEKLKRLRQELETARGLVKDVLQREQMRKNLFDQERQIFETRRKVIDIKRKLQIKGDDEDLINKPKRTRPEQTAPPALRIPVRHDGKPPEADLKQMAQVEAEQKRVAMERYQQLRRARHKPDLVDITEVSLDFLHDLVFGLLTIVAACIIFCTNL